MHGRVKVRTTAQEQELKRKEREKKVKVYKTAISRVFTKRSQNELDEEMLDITAQLLLPNPDIYTLWNIRRETFLYFKENRENDELQQLMEGELQLTERCLKANPKSYCTYHHRLWILENMPRPNWKQELFLCNKYLDLDERNFHVWNYRRIVVKKSGISAEEEFAFSTSQITKNFSNYSSWHYRSKLLPQIFPDPNGVRPVSEVKHEEELQLVQNATFTDPSDQSAWFYQRWLLGRSKQPLKIAQALSSQTVTFVSLSHSVSLYENSETKVEVHMNGRNVPGKWKSTSGRDYSHVWIFSPISGASVEPIELHLFIGNKKVDCLSLQEYNSKGVFQGHTGPQFEAQFSDGLTSVLEEQLESCRQLLKLEPDSKWTLLTSVLLMQAIDRNKYKDETMEKIEQLLNIDILRTGYYKDLRSKYIMEYAVDDLMKNLNENNSVVNFNMSSHQLTALYHCQYLSILSHVNFTSNFLGRSLHKLHPLQCCKVLILNDCSITSLEQMPHLVSLQELFLKDNEIVASSNLHYLKHCINIEVLDLRGNPVSNELGTLTVIADIFPNIKSFNGKTV